MITADAQQMLEDLEERAPKRLRRVDVAALRELHRQALRDAKTIPSQREQFLDALAAAGGQVTEPVHMTPTRVLRVFASRDERDIARAKLGVQVSHVSIHMQWTEIVTLGIDVNVYARPLNHAAMRIGSHRFRGDTGPVQFCREVSRLVRLGLGYCHRYDSTLVNVLS